VTNAPETERPRLLRTMFAWGIGMAVTAQVLTLLVFLLPSSLP
jgi:hypothetical protein